MEEAMSGIYKRYNSLTIVSVCPEEVAFFRRWGISTKNIKTLDDLLAVRKRARHILKRDSNFIKVCGFKL